MKLAESKNVTTEQQVKNTERVLQEKLDWLDVHKVQLETCVSELNLELMKSDVSCLKSSVLVLLFGVIVALKNFVKF